MKTIRLIFLLLFIPVLFSCSESRQRSDLRFTISNPTANGSRYPVLYSPDGNRFYMSWISGLDEQFYALQYTVRDQGRWQQPTTVNVGGDPVFDWRLPPVVAPMGDEVAFAWLRWYMGYPDGGQQQLHISIPAGERNWYHVFPFPPARPFSFSMIPAGPESVLAIQADEEGLKAALVRPDGTFARIDPPAGSLCEEGTTDLIRSGGSVLALWEECEGERRRIRLAAYDPVQDQWGTPATVHEGAIGDPFTPALADADGEQGRVVVIWSETVDPAQSEGRTDRAEAESAESAESTGPLSRNPSRLVRAAFSEDRGESFAAPVRIGTMSGYRRIDVTSAPDGTFRAVWLRMGSSLANVVLQPFGPSGPIGEPVNLGATSPLELSGSPTLVGLEEGVLVAWTQTDPIIQTRTLLYPYQDHTQSAQ